jgi:hypothetical protein
MKACFEDQAESLMPAHLYEEKVFIVECVDSAEALKIGASIGQESSERYQTNDGQWLQWVLENVTTVCEISEPGNGSEVFFRFLTPADAAAIQRKIE